MNISMKQGPKPINIAFFSSNTLIGGAETNILLISEELVKAGFNVHFLCLENNGNLLDNKPHFFCSSNVIGRYERYPYKSVYNYYKFLKNNDIDVISCFGLRVDIFVRVLTKLFNRNIKIVSN